jgi:hypothetical protein
MRYFVRKLTGAKALSSLCAVVFAFASMVSATSVQASNTPDPGRADLAAVQGPKAKRTARTAMGPYFIEFRSRYALSYGHTFAMFGRLNAHGDIVQREVAGLHPAGDSPVPWMIGHVIPVTSETGPSDGDLEEKYVSARYRVVLSEDEYVRLVAFIRKLQANSPLWSAVAYNCNAFVAQIAKYLGLQTPSSTLLYPADFITKLRDLNEGRTRATIREAPPVQ